MWMWLASRDCYSAGTSLCLCFLMAGCSLFSGASKLHTSAKGSVQLQEVSDWAFEATHPAVIDHLTMNKVLIGVLADDPTPAMAKMPPSGSKPMRVFSD